MGNMTRRPFTHKPERSKEFMCGLMASPARGGYEYFIIFTNDCSCFSYIYLMRCMSDSFEKCKEFKAEVEHQTGKLAKVLRSDCGREYLFGEFKYCLVHHGIVYQTYPIGYTLAE